VEKSSLIKNYQYYEGNINKNIVLDFTKGREYNEEGIKKWYKTYPSVNEKQRTEWNRLVLMIIYFEITCGRYDTAKKFKEADEKHEVVLHQHLIPAHVREIEYETNEL
jgi:predicted MPP superfamily phosphohydrolase